MKPFITAVVIAFTLITLILYFDPASVFSHGMNCDGSIGGGCDRSTAKGIWSWMAK